MPMLGLHLATLAKLTQYIGGQHTKALRTAEESQSILQATHRNLSTEDGHGVLAELHQIVSEASLEMSSEAQKERYDHLQHE